MLTQDDEDKIHEYQVEGGPIPADVALKLKSLRNTAGFKRMLSDLSILAEEHNSHEILLYRGCVPADVKSSTIRTTAWSVDLFEAQQFARPTLLKAYIPLKNILLYLPLRDLLYDQSRYIEYQDGGAREDEHEVWVLPGNFDIQEF